MKTSVRHRSIALPRPKLPRLSVRHLFTQVQPDAAVSTFLQSLPANIESLASAPDHADSASAVIVVPSTAAGHHHGEDGPCAEVVVPCKSGGQRHEDCPRVEISGTSSPLRLPWLTCAIDLAIQEHKAALRVIPFFQNPPSDKGVQIPISISDEAWMHGYMNQTAIILDACNAFSTRVSDLEHGLLNIRYAIHVLDDMQKKGMNEEKWQRARKAMRDSLELWETGKGMAFADEKNKGTDCLTTVNDMCRGLVAPSEKAMARGKSFLLALYGANAVAVLVFVVLALTFSPDEKLLSIDLGISNQMQWSVPVNKLLQMAKSQATQCIEGGFKLCLWEFLILKDTVVAVLGILDSTDGKVAFDEQQTELLASHVKGLRMHLDDLMHGLESIGKKLNDLFQAVVKSRSALLDKVGSPT